MRDTNWIFCCNVNNFRLGNEVLKRTVQIILAWQGFRFDVEGMSTAMKIGYFLTILALAVIGFVLGSVAAPPGFLAALVVFGWMSYYLGNTLCLTRLNRILISKWGEERAWHCYVIVCGCLFSMQSESNTKITCTSLHCFERHCVSIGLLDARLADRRHSFSALWLCNRADAYDVHGRHDSHDLHHVHARSEHAASRAPRYSHQGCRAALHGRRLPPLRWFSHQVCRHLVGRSRHLLLQGEFGNLHTVFLTVFCSYRICFMVATRELVSLSAAFTSTSIRLCMVLATFKCVRGAVRSPSLPCF